MSHLYSLLEGSRKFQNDLSVTITNAPFLVAMEAYP